MIRWAHGLLRVWTVFTVLWISVSGLVLLWNEKPAFDFSNPWDVVSKYPRSNCIETAGRGWCWDETKEYLSKHPPTYDQTKEFLSRRNLFDDLDPPIARQPVFDPSSPIRPLVSTKPIVADAGKIIGPPILLLFIGCALWWIGRGFRPAEPKPNRRTP